MYWHDLRKEEKFFSTRQNGGRGVMVCRAMSWYGLYSLVVVNGSITSERYSLVVVNGSITSERYCAILEAVLLPFVEEFAPQDWVFQQDNASAHRARDTHTWFLTTILMFYEFYRPQSGRELLGNPCP